MIIESLHDRSINKQNMHAFTLYHISLQRKIHVNSITFVQDSISCCFITIIGESAFSGSNIGLPCCFVLISNHIPLCACIIQKTWKPFLRILALFFTLFVLFDLFKCKKSLCFRAFLSFQNRNCNFRTKWRLMNKIILVKSKSQIDGKEQQV